MEELDLIQQAKAGNKSAINTLLKDNYRIVYGYVLKMTGNVQTTEDIVQDTMLKALVNLPKYKPEAKFSTWLVTIATNVYRDLLRKNKHFKDVQELDADTVYAADGVHGIDHQTGIEEQVVAKLEVKQVVEILMKLTYEKRAAFILKNYYGYKYEEIAEILGCPIGTVRSRIHSCMIHILKEMKGSEV